MPGAFGEIDDFEVCTATFLAVTMPHQLYRLKLAMVSAWAPLCCDCIDTCCLYFACLTCAAMVLPAP
jgi:hypothetical protein